MFLKSKLLTAKHGFFTRELNCGFGHGDRDEVVNANRQLALKKIGGETLITAKQIHSDIALIINGSGNYEADALVTDKHSLAIGILTADCVPILLQDKQKQHHRRRPFRMARRAFWRDRISNSCYAKPRR